MIIKILQDYQTVFLTVGLICYYVRSLMGALSCINLKFIYLVIKLSNHVVYILYKSWLADHHTVKVARFAVQSIIKNNATKSASNLIINLFDRILFNLRLYYEYIRLLAVCLSLFKAAKYTQVERNSITKSIKYVCRQDISILKLLEYVASLPERAKELWEGKSKAQNY